MPAALGANELLDVTYNAGSILIPILPSAIDVKCGKRMLKGRRESGTPPLHSYKLQHITKITDKKGGALGEKDL